MRKLFHLLWVSVDFTCVWVLECSDLLAICLSQNLLVNLLLVSHVSLLHFFPSSYVIFLVLLHLHLVFVPAEFCERLCAC